MHLRHTNPVRIRLPIVARDPARLGTRRDVVVGRQEDARPVVGVEVQVGVTEWGRGAREGDKVDLGRYVREVGVDVGGDFGR